MLLAWIHSQGRLLAHLASATTASESDRETSDLAPLDCTLRLSTLAIRHRPPTAGAEINTAVAAQSRAETEAGLLSIARDSDVITGDSDVICHAYTETRLPVVD